MSRPKWFDISYAEYPGGLVHTHRTRYDQLNLAAAKDSLHQAGCVIVDIEEVA